MKVKYVNRIHRVVRFVKKMFDIFILRLLTIPSDRSTVIILPLRCIRNGHRILYENISNYDGGDRKNMTVIYCCAVVIFFCIVGRIRSTGEEDEMSFK